MRKACDQAQQHRQTALFGQFKAIGSHIVGFLLVGGFEHRQHGECAVETAVLLVLRRVHGRVVGGYYYEPAVGPGHRRVHEGVGSYVQPYMFHCGDGALAAERHAQGFFYSCFFIGRPVGVDVAFLCHRILLHELEDFGRRCAGVRIGAG